MGVSVPWRTRAAGGVAESEDRGHAEEVPQTAQDEAHNEAEGAARLMPGARAAGKATEEKEEAARIKMRTRGFAMGFCQKWWETFSYVQECLAFSEVVGVTWPSEFLGIGIKQWYVTVIGMLVNMTNSHCN